MVRRAAPVPWIGVDLDGTLARYDGWRPGHHIGEPIPEMVERVKQWIAEGKAVRIFTARVFPPTLPCRHARTAIQAWCMKNLGRELPVTCCKDRYMQELWDDRAVGVEANTGRKV